MLCKGTAQCGAGDHIFEVRRERRSYDKLHKPDLITVPVKLSFTMMSGNRWTAAADVMFQLRRCSVSVEDCGQKQKHASSIKYAVKHTINEIMHSIKFWLSLKHIWIYNIYIHCAIYIALDYRYPYISWWAVRSYFWPLWLVSVCVSRRPRVPLCSEIKWIWVLHHVYKPAASAPQPRMPSHKHTV